MVRKQFPLAAELEYPAGTLSCSTCQEQVISILIVMECFQWRLRAAYTAVVVSVAIETTHR